MLAITILSVGCTSVTNLKLSYKTKEQKESQQNKGIVNIYPFKDATPKDPKYSNYIGAAFGVLGNRGGYIYTMQTDISSYITDAFSKYLKANGYDVTVISPTPTTKITKGVILDGEIKEFFLKDKIVIIPLPFAPTSHNLNVKVFIKVKIIDETGNVLLEKDMLTEVSGTGTTGEAPLLHFVGGTGTKTLEDNMINFLNIGLTDVFRKILTNPEIQKHLGFKDEQK